MNANERTASIKDAVDRRKTAPERVLHSVARTLVQNVQDFQKYSVPVDALALNIDNRRFAAEAS